MIFPDVRISELKKDLEIKEAALDQSCREFSAALKDKSTYASLLRQNTKGILTTALAGYFLSKTLFRLVTPWKLPIYGLAMLRSRWGWKILKALAIPAGRFALKKLVP